MIALAPMVDCACGCGLRVAPVDPKGRPRKYYFGHANRPATSASERFRQKYVVEPSGCWRWTGFIASHGYGRFRMSPDPRVHEPAHRASYILSKGPIPVGFQIDHLCGNRSCVNPEHLEAVPPQVNNERSSSPSAVNGRKTHCHMGHPFDSTNTWVNKKGQRICRACKNDYQRARRRPQGVAVNEP